MLRKGMTLGLLVLLAGAATAGAVTHTGTYTGTTAQNFAITIHVHGSTVGIVNFNINYSCAAGVVPPNGQTEFALPGGLKIGKSGTFSGTFKNVAPQESTVTITGKFHGAHVTGVLTDSFQNGGACLSGKVAYSAHR
jgi:hypothetical protein